MNILWSHSVIAEMGLNAGCRVYLGYTGINEVFIAAMAIGVFLNVFFEGARYLYGQVRGRLVVSIAKLQEGGRYG